MLMDPTECGEKWCRREGRLTGIKSLRRWEGQDSLFQILYFISVKWEVGSEAVNEDGEDVGGLRRRKKVWTNYWGEWEGRWGNAVGWLGSMKNVLGNHRFQVKSEVWLGFILWPCLYKFSAWVGEELNLTRTMVWASNSDERICVWEFKTQGKEFRGVKQNDYNNWSHHLS